MSRLIYGWVPDLPDKRDFKFSAVRPTLKVLPPSTNLQSYATTIEDQGDEGSCTANAWVSVIEYLVRKHRNILVDFSRQFLYYQERFLEGTVSWDSGATLRDGAKALVQFGVCYERTWPYIIPRMTRKPSKAAYREALLHQVTAYHRLYTLRDMKQCLAQGYPFVFGMSVYESFETEEVATTGIVPMPNVSSEQLLGGHALAAFGYDDSRQAFLIRNSWGINWGLNGYCWIPYSYLEDRDLSDDFWTATAGELM